MPGSGMGTPRRRDQARSRRRLACGWRAITLGAGAEERLATGTGLGLAVAGDGFRFTLRLVQKTGKPHPHGLMQGSDVRAAACQRIAFGKTNKRIIDGLVMGSDVRAAAKPAFCPAICHCVRNDAEAPARAGKCRGEGGADTQPWRAEDPVPDRGRERGGARAADRLSQRAQCCARGEARLSNPFTPILILSLVLCSVISTRRLSPLRTTATWSHYLASLPSTYRFIQSRSAAFCARRIMGGPDLDPSWDMFGIRSISTVHPLALSTV
jgi:hypothetical protein